MINITEIKSQVGALEQLRKTEITALEKAEERLKKAQIDMNALDRIRKVMLDVGIAVQGQVKEYLEAVVTSALQTVYQEPFEFKVDFGIKWDQPVAELTVIDPDSGEPVSIRDDQTGGGVADVCSFALLMACWALEPEGTFIPLMILDEPFKFLDATNMPRAAQLVKELSIEMGLQIIMVSHNEILIQAGDKVFHVRKRRGVARVKVVKDG